MPLDDQRSGNLSGTYEKVAALDNWSGSETVAMANLEYYEMTSNLSVGSNHQSPTTGGVVIAFRQVAQNRAVQYWPY